MLVAPLKYVFVLKTVCLTSPTAYNLPIINLTTNIMFKLNL